MRWKAVFSSMLLAVGLLLSSCGGKSGQELLVGIQGNKDSISFAEDQAVQDPEAIEEFKSIVAADHETAANPPKGDSHYVIHVNNWDASTLEIWVNLWLQQDGTIIFNRGSGEYEYHVIDKEKSSRVKELTGIQ